MTNRSSVIACFVSYELYEDWWPWPSTFWPRIVQPVTYFIGNVRSEYDLELSSAQDRRRLTDWEVQQRNDVSYWEVRIISAWPSSSATFQYLEATRRVLSRELKYSRLTTTTEVTERTVTLCYVIRTGAVNGRLSYKRLATVTTTHFRAARIH